MKILLAVDGSACSETAVVEVARRPWPADSEIRIFAAAELPDPLLSNPEALPPGFAEDLEKAARTQAEAAIGSALAKFREHAVQNVSVTTGIVVDSAREGILDEAERWDADLIVVGSHGYRGNQGSLLGSVSQAIAAQARCSVEIARARRTDDDED